MRMMSSLFFMAFFSSCDGILAILDDVSGVLRQGFSGFGQLQAPMGAHKKL